MNYSADYLIRLNCRSREAHYEWQDMGGEIHSLEQIALAQLDPEHAERLLSEFYSVGRRDGRLARPQKAILSPLVRRQSRLVADDN